MTEYIAIKTDFSVTWLSIRNSADVMSLSFISGDGRDGDGGRRD